MAIAGGRNLAKEYFLRGTEGNFIDFDMLVAGAVLPALNGGFDAYWNSAQAYPVQAIATPRIGSPDSATDAAFRAAFEVSTRPENTPAPAPAAVTYGVPPLSTALAAGRVKLIATAGRAFADSPAKADPTDHSEASADTVSRRFLKLLGSARSDILLFSPYFIPGADTMDELRRVREAGVRVRDARP